jgi:eukaryotic-like serine/threonine-protein kinase
VAALRPGDVVAGKYRVGHVLGEGGMAIVLAATHEQLDQRVALKFLLPAVAADPDIVQRFLREARAAVRIQSEHVARVLDVGTHEGAPYMVMEYLEGEDVARTLAAGGALPVDRAVGYLLEACEAIAEAHSLGIVHRDLKPANLFLAQTRSGRSTIKVLDFGISKAPAIGNDANTTNAAAIMGSPYYMSPEQLVSSASVDLRSDVWSLGVVLYEMLVCRLPFLAETMPALVAAILAKPPQPIGDHRGDVPIALQAVIHRCLNKEPAQRYADVAELARSLEPFGPPRCEQSVERIEHVLAQVGAVRSPSPRPAAATANRAAAFTFAPTTSRSVPARSRHLLVTVPLATVTVAAIAVAVFFAMRSPTMTHSAPAPTAMVPAIPSPPAVPSEAPATLVTLDPPSPPPASASAPTVVAPKVTTPKLGGRASPLIREPPWDPSPASSCRVVHYFDENGNKHFKQDCP